MSEPKQVIVVRSDLDMSPGKIAAQAAHASVKAVQSVSEAHEDVLEEWNNGSFVKICLKVDSEVKLLELYNDAQNASLPRSIIKDEGRTELHGQHYTAMAIGPADSDEINKITGHLSLLR